MIGGGIAILLGLTVTYWVAFKQGQHYGINQASEAGADVVRDAVLALEPEQQAKFKQALLDQRSKL